MPSDRRLLGGMLKYLAERIDAGRVNGSTLEFIAAGSKKHVINVGDFTEIPDTDGPRRIAFVDGGNAMLAEAPSFVIYINRVYYSMFSGRRREKPIRQPRVEFFSCMTSKSTPSQSSNTHADEAYYSTRLFTRNDADHDRLPQDDDLGISRNDAKSQGLSRESLRTMPREMAEWAVAGSVIDGELNDGDILVMDGTLQTRSVLESKFAAPICKKATQKGVVLCGLAKTSTLVTTDNLPLIGRASELAETAGLRGRRWFVGVCNRATANDMGYMYIVRFHERSRYTFRFSVLGEQHEGMAHAEVESVLASIAANSRDISMPGYPYGAIDADRFAKVRNREAAMHRNMLDAELACMPGGEGIAAQIRSMSMHRALNRVTG